MTIWMHVKLTLNQISYVTIRNPVTKSLYVYKSGIFKILKNQNITNLNFFNELWKYLTGNFKIHIIIQNSWQLKIIFRPDYTLYSNSKCKNNIQNFKTKSYPICSLTGRQTHTICSFKILWLPRTIPLF